MLYTGTWPNLTALRAVRWPMGGGMAIYQVGAAEVERACGGGGREREHGGRKTGAGNIQQGGPAQDGKLKDTTKK